MVDPAEKFTVRYDAAMRQLRWTMRGFWAMADVAGFAAALRDAVAPLGPPPHRYDGICDASQFPVQSGEVSAALGEIDRIGGAMRQGRLAIIVASTINKLQVERTLRSDGVRVFLTLDDAQSWLSQKPTEQS